MFQSHNGLTLRNAVLAFGTLAMLFAANTQGLPTVVGGELTAERRNWKSPDHGHEKGIPDCLSKFPADSLNKLLKAMSNLPKGEKKVDVLAKKVLTPLQKKMADKVGIKTSKDDIAQKAPCADVTLIFARGTTEPGNVGCWAGPPLFDALDKKLKNKSLAVQGVDYPATFAGFNDNGIDGVPSMTKYINKAMIDCPNTKVVLSGYSQGALVVRNTCKALPAETMAKISSVVTFGDPKNKEPMFGAEDKSMVICQEDDVVCQGGYINVAHLTYSEKAGQAAEFVDRCTSDTWKQ